MHNTTYLLTCPLTRNFLENFSLPTEFEPYYETQLFTIHRCVRVTPSILRISHAPYNASASPCMTWYDVIWHVKRFKLLSHTLAADPNSLSWILTAPICETMHPRDVSMSSWRWAACHWICHTVAQSVINRWYSYAVFIYKWGIDPLSLYSNCLFTFLVVSTRSYSHHGFGCERCV